MKPTAAWLSVTGSVLGMAQTAVNPPAAAAMRAGRDRLDVLLARLAQVHVQVDQPGRDDQAGRVEHLRAVGRAEVAAHRRDLAVREKHVGDARRCRATDR